MSSLATALKKEIQRLAKKEAVAVVKDVKVAMKEERAQVKTLQGTIKDQAKKLLPCAKLWKAPRWPLQLLPPLQ